MCFNISGLKNFALTNINLINSPQAGKVPLFYGKKLQIKSRKVTEIKPLAKIATHHEIDKGNILALLEEAGGCILKQVLCKISQVIIAYFLITTNLE